MLDADVLRALRARADRRRRLLAAVVAGVAAAIALHEASPGPVPVVGVLAAARDLPAGAVLSAGDVRVVRLPRPVVPAGALRRGALAAGRVLASAVRRGEPLTDVRLVGPSLLAAARLPPGWVAVSVPLADAGVVVARAGDRVDVLAAGDARAGPASGEVDPARVVAAAVVVLAVPHVADGAVVVVGCAPATARALAAAAARDRLSLAVRGSP